ncbi:hypothetical protein niasHT_017215 [Heterodera trifolii]|uniref:STAC3-related SH3 domain-containing protein n=1 Tax=Heterodera trifolii TaxID=157864 RepID=A0ABD2L395_9BILA
MIAGKYKSAEYLHYYHHYHHPSEHQLLARNFFDSEQHNYHCQRHQQKKHHSVRRSSLQPQHNHRHHQQHNYPWEYNNHHRYQNHHNFIGNDAAPNYEFEAPNDENAFDSSAVAGANCRNHRRPRRQLPLEPKVGAEAELPLLKSAHSANTLLGRKSSNQQHHYQMMISTGVPMASASGSSNSWSNRLNKAGNGTEQWCQEDGANMVIHRNSHPSLFNDMEAKRIWQTAANQPDQQPHQSQRPPGSSRQIVMATSPKVRALRRGISTAMNSSKPRPSLISQRSLQGPIGSPKLTTKRMSNHQPMAPNDQQLNWGINLSDTNSRRKNTSGAFFCASNSSSSSPFTPNEAFPSHFTPPSAGAGSSHDIDSPQSTNSPIQPPQCFSLLFTKQHHLSNVRANSNPTICLRRGGGIERQILRRSPNSDLAPRFQRHHQQLNGDQQQRQAPDECSRGSSFSSESAPAGRNGAAAIAGAGLGGGGSGSSTEHDPDNIDPVYLALKQATEKYGTPAGSRRGSQNVVTMMVDSSTPSPRDLSQTSLQDSGTYSGNEYCGAGALLRHHPPFATGGGSTPQLHGISVGKGSSVGISGNSDCVNSTNCQQPLSSGGRRPKLSEKMKSLSLDCAEMPDPVQNGMANRQQQYKSKPIRSARGGLASVQQSFDKSASPNGRQQTGPLGAIQLVPHKQRRLPPVPSAAPQAVIVPQQQHHNNNNSNIMHIIIHEYSSADCVLRPGDRVVVVDNGDPDWKHGFKFNDCLEHLLTFPSSCVAAYHMEEQPMKLLQSCNLVEQKIRLYRDQIVFAQPNGLSEDGRLLLVRNEHSKLAHCPLHFLTLT